MNILAPEIGNAMKLGGGGPAEQLARVLLDGISRPALLLSTDGTVMECNRAAQTVAELGREELIGRRMEEVFCREGGCELAAALRQAVAGAAQGTPAHVAAELPSKSGARATVTLDFNIRAVADDAGPAVFLVAEGRDISAERPLDREAALLECPERERRRLQEMLALTPAAMGLLLGRELRWAFVNPDYLRMTGRASEADLLGKTLYETMPEMEAQGLHSLIAEAYRSGKPYSGQETKARFNRSASGQPEEGYFDFVFQPVRDAEGKVEGVFVYAREVTGGVAARQLSEANAERLRLAQAAGQIGMWEWDPVRETQNLSPELHRIFATDADDPERTKKWLERIHPADRNRVELLMYEGHRLGTMEFEYRYLHPQLGQRWLFCKGQRRPGESRMLGVVQDITVRKTAEQAAQRLAAIVESSEDAIVSKNLHGIVTSWNPGAERIFGYTAEEMIGQPITKIIPPELYGDETRILSTIARGERIQHFETVRVKKNGQPVEISLTISPVRDESGRVIGAAKIARDITQRKTVEQALRMTERLASVGRLAATIAHEINNPLEALTNLVYLARRAKAEDQIARYLDMAQEELNRMSQLTRQTLGFYRETQGATAVRVGELVESLLAVFTPRMRNRGIEMRAEIRDDVEITAVPGEIRQVIANLVSNSIDALSGGGRIRVRVSRAVQWNEEAVRGVRLTIGDTGSGIAPEIRAQLFEPFFTTKKKVGTGLGLWICKSIAENHRGTIRVKSSTMPARSGTVFSVFLPLNHSATIVPGGLLRRIA